MVLPANPGSSWLRGRTVNSAIPGHKSAPESFFSCSGRAEIRAEAARSSGTPRAGPDLEKATGRGVSARSSFSREGYALSSQGVERSSAAPSATSSEVSRRRWRWALGMEDRAASIVGSASGRLDSCKDRHNGRLTLGRECGQGRKPSESPTSTNPAIAKLMPHIFFRSCILTAFSPFPARGKPLFFLEASLSFSQTCTFSASFASMMPIPATQSLYVLLAVRAAEL